jgi:hypothetical protein
MVKGDSWPTQLGPAMAFKSFEAGVIVQVKAKGNKLRKRPRIAVTHVEYQHLFGVLLLSKKSLCGHCYELTE